MNGKPFSPPLYPGDAEDKNLDSTVANVIKAKTPPVGPVGVPEDDSIGYSLWDALSMGILIGISGDVWTYCFDILRLSSGHDQFSLINDSVGKTINLLAKQLSYSVVVHFFA